MQVCPIPLLNISAMAEIRPDVFHRRKKADAANRLSRMVINGYLILSVNFMFLFFCINKAVIQKIRYMPKLRRRSVFPFPLSKNKTGNSNKKITI